MKNEKKRDAQTSMNESTKIITAPLKWIWKGGVFLAKGRVLKSKTGAKFDAESSYSDYLKPNNRGLVLDGQSLALSEQESFKGVFVLSRVGAGKTSRYIIPNVLQRANENCSMVINDPKGEVFEKTSHRLKKRGFRIITIDSYYYHRP